MMPRLHVKAARQGCIAEKALGCTEELGAESVVYSEATHMISKGHTQRCCVFEAVVGLLE